MRGAPISPSRFSALPARPGARRVDDDDVRVAGALAQVAQHLADVAREERRVADRVQLLVLDRAGDRLLADLDPPHRHRVARHREADRADAAVEVVDGLVARRAPRTRARSRRAAPPSRVFVCRNAFGRTRKRRPPISSSIASSPQSSSVGRFVISATPSLTDQWIDLTSGNCGQHLDQALAVEALAARSSRAARAPGRCCGPRGSQMPQVALVRLLVVGRQLLLARPLAHRVADRVAERRSSASTSRSRAPRPSGRPCAGRASHRPRAA